MKQAIRVVGYVRVSTDEQAKDGASLDLQETKIEQYVELHGLVLVAIDHDDGVSGKTLKRPGLSRALGRLDSGEADAIVVYGIDRLTRSLRDWSTLIERYFAEGRKVLMSVSESIDTR